MLATPNPAFVGQPVTLSAVISPPTTGVIVFLDYAYGPLGTGQIDPATGQTSLIVPSFGPGPHTLVARFEGSVDLSPSDSAPVPLDVQAGPIGPTPTTVSFAASPNPALIGNPVGLEAAILPIPDGGTVIFTEGNLVLGTAGIDVTTGKAILAVASLAPGSHVIFATFTGSALFAAAASTPLMVTIEADTVVTASRFAVAPGSIFPFVDGYRDTVEVRGRLAEAASVTIAIFSSTGTRVRSAGLGTKDGAYSWTWNGRSNAGKVVVAGRYRVVQTLKDRAGNSLEDARFVTVSSKRVVYKTASITKHGDQFSAWDESAYAWVSTTYSDYPRGVELFGNLYDEYAIVRYTFSLPSAVAYKTVKFEVRGRGYAGYGGAAMSILNVEKDTVDAVKVTGTSYRWYATSASGATHVDGRRVDAFVSVHGINEGAFDVQSVRLTYTYGVLQ